MVNTRIKISSIVENQLPSFVRENFPLVGDFLSQYYKSLENDGGVYDILQNIDQYVKLDELTNLVESTTTTSLVEFSDDVINVNSTNGFPDSYGLIQIDSEIITYTSKTNTTFNGCVRGFSGTTSYQDPNTPDHLVFSSSEVSEHANNSTVSNLSVLFLKEFFKKIKRQVLPGFEDRELYSNLNKNLFIKQSKDFYSSKGTDQSFEILFRSLYGEDVEVIKPRDYLFIPSDAQYRISKDLVVKSLEGNPENLINRTLYQDATNYFDKAVGSINKVEKIYRGTSEYYVISLDYNEDSNERISIDGNFSIHSQTKLTTSVSIGSTVLDVDSTIGFPNSGELIVDFANGSSVTIKYTSKSYTQFYGCSGVTQNISSGQDIRINSYAYGYSGIGTDSVVKVQVTGVLSDLTIDKNSRYYQSGDPIKIRTFGKDSLGPKANNWIFNIPTTYDVNTVTLVDSSNFTYQIRTYDNNNFSIGEPIKLLLSDGTEKTSTIVSIVSKNSFNVNGQGQLATNLNYKVRRDVLKGKFINFPEANLYSTNVQNIYEDTLNSDSYYVTSNSLPSYLNENINVTDRSVTFSGTFNGKDILIPNHGFYTGDSVTYIPKSEQNSLNIQEGIYFVKKVDSNTIKISRSRENLYKENYIDIIGTVTDSKFIFTSLAYQKLDSQKLIRNIRTAENTTNVNLTTPGQTGILVNGVEILNYKSNDKIFYGPIERIDVLTQGKDYDVINPPVLSIFDSVGSGATGYCEVRGKLEKINIIDPGFDYIENPIVTITGGSGSGAKAEADLFYFKHSVSFNSIPGANQINLSDDTISFSDYHKFRDAEQVVYNSDGQLGVGGLSTNSTYYVSVQDSYKVKLHKTYLDAVAGINTINLTSYGVGNQSFSSVELKNKIASIRVTDSGSGYKNRKISLSPSNININSDVILAKNHNYQSGEIIVYTATGTPIGGLTSGESYYVSPVDENSFKLSKVGYASTIGVGSAVVGVTTNSDFYYKTKQYIELTSIGSGLHQFNYQQIQVKVSGLIGVSTRTDQNFNAVTQPIVRGQIESVFLESGGLNYGSEEVINFNRQPSITLKSGEGAEVTPIISNGKIEKVLVISPGYGYNSPPSFEIIGPGSSAVLTPVITNGSLTDVKVVSGGVGFVTSRTIINVIPSGSGANFASTPKIWTINLVERNIQSNQISDDDGIIDNGINSSYGLQYTHLYAPRNLRKTILSGKIVNGNLVYSSDLIFRNNREILSDSHSPIIGWAYDGNPIYGPYGYSTSTGGPVKVMESGYKIFTDPQRPKTSLYPQGFFVEDYQYNASGDLDKYNGRYCVTPEYPNGVYAYFTTIDGTSTESFGPFRNYRKPVFPYFIGNEFKSNPINYNFLPASNQDDVDINKLSVLRNTTPYNLNSKKSEYEFLKNPNKIKPQTSVVEYSIPGTLDSVGIITGGSNYKVLDKLVFDNNGTGGQGASAEVSSVKGKQVNQISVNSVKFNDVEFISFGKNSFIGFATAPHNLLDRDLITVTGISTFGSKLEQQYNIGVRSDIFSLISSVPSSSSTGIVTYFDVYGPLLYPNIRENDILTIESERVKVLNVDSNLKRIRVLREQNSTVGSSHTASSLLYEDPRKFYFTPVGINSSLFEYTLNSEIYFDPKESVGLGTVFGVGIGYTLRFSNPGAGLTSLNIPTKSIYLPNHRLTTGDELIYSSNGGNPISISTDGITSSQLIDNQIVYAARVTSNLIGISTVPVAFGSNGDFVGIGSFNQSSTSFITSVGTGVVHSFKTNFKTNIKGKIQKNLVTVSTASTHGLQLNDNVKISCLSGISTTYTVRYNDGTRRTLINPKNFISANVDIVNDTISITSHGYETGQKIVHTSNSPVGGLENNKIYFIVKVDNDRFKLSETSYNSLLPYPICVNLTSTSSGTISLVNPKINAVRNQSVIFDLSDISLSYLKNSTRYSAFDFNIYTDPEFKNIFKTSGFDNNFEVSRSGIIGVSTDAKVTLKITDNIPKVLYYKLDPVNFDDNDKVKTEIINDFDAINSPNSIFTFDSIYSGNQIISGVTSTTFSYNIFNSPERSSYISSEAKISYTTDSKNSYGEIDSVKINSIGYQYRKLPGISTISTQYGSGAVLLPSSNSIGKIKKVKIEDIGFEYSADKSLKPEAVLPQILKITSSYRFKKIGISSVGKNYTISPDLIAIDSVTNSKIENLDIRYKLGDSEVSIFKNTNGVNENVRIIPINNSNGIGINSITYNNTTNDVTVYLSPNYSNLADYPFAVGDKILIENVSVGSATTVKGYNSSSYGYALFTLKSVTPNIGGSNGYVTYNISNYLSVGQHPGTFDPISSKGKITPEKFFPTFNISLEKNEFFLNESITSNSATGKIVGWNKSNDILKVFGDDLFVSSERIFASSSNSQATILSVEDYNSFYDVSGSSIVIKGWQKETGFLNNDLQRIHDSDYYQYFSYDLKSKVEYEKWNDPVSSMNHTAGFKKFGNLIIESSDSDFSGISTEQNSGDFVGIADFERVIDLNCVSDFDLAKEKSVTIDSKVVSDEIILKSTNLQDYFESIGNRVLSIDDISDEFSSSPRPTQYSIVETFTLESGRTRKFIVYVKDMRFTSERQTYIVTILHSGTDVYINQYGRIETASNMGTFDVSISGSEASLLFYPTKYEVNNFDISYVSYNTEDQIAGIGTLSLGNVVDIKTSNQLIPSGTTGTTTIVGIASTYRSSKVLVTIGATDGSYYEFDEVSLLHDGTNVEILEYGQLTDDEFGSYSSAGLGTYGAQISGSNVNLTFTPYVGVGVSFIVNTLRVSIGNTTSTGIGTENLTTSQLSSNYISIASSTSPVQNIVSQYDLSEYNSAYYVVLVEDTTNNRTQMSEVVVVDDGSTALITEFGEIYTHSGLGTVGAGISGSNVQLYFTPISGISADIRVFQNSLKTIDLSETKTGVDLLSGSIDVGSGEYKGTFADVKRQFNLTSKQIPIFERNFDGGSSSVVNTTENTIRIPGHFFVTGEEIVYTHAGAGTTQAIGIATTSIVGFGTTDKLPSTVYAIKVDDLDIKLASSIENALKTIPVELNITTVGIGTSHTFTAKNQNSRVLVSLDNVIQSPIVSTAITTLTSKYISIIDDTVELVGITSIFGGDLIKINDEILRVNSVGFGTTNGLLVERSWMGTGLSTHAQNSLVTKVNGNYNIVNNLINFITAPYGPVPIGTSSNKPSERDWSGITTHSIFSGRSFIRSGIKNTSQEPYSKNYIFDDISGAFTGITTQFKLTSNGNNISGISTSNAIVLVNEIFQEPRQKNVSLLSEFSNYTLIENVGVTSIQFTGSIASSSYDINTSNVPVGGIIVSVGSSKGFGYQPLVAAGGTAIVSSAGTISAISIGNSGSGYRSGIQTVVNVGVATSSTGASNIQFIGTASISNGNIVSVAITNPGTGYTSTNPPIVFFDDPLSYSNIPLIYSSTSNSGVGTKATVDIVVGQGSSVVDFTIKNFGYGYGQGEILTVAIGGTVGIPTNSSLPYTEFEIIIEKTQSDKFSGWSIGDLEVFDSIDYLFDGKEVAFQLYFNGIPKSIKARSGSLIDVQSTLLVFLNDILQVPGEGYIFEGGSYITFTEPPKPGDFCKIIFYKGTGDVDVLEVDVLETIKKGDTVKLDSDIDQYKENERLVTNVVSIDTINTNPYSGPGVTQNVNLERPLVWCRQTEDLFIDGNPVTKDREIYESIIKPASNIIQNVGIGSTVMYVESVKTFFDNTKENVSNSYISEIEIVSQDSIISCSATAVVSAAGTISSIVISDGGVGYTTSPTVTISNPVGLGTTQRATATASISIGGTVSSITITSPGTGYTTSNPPVVLLETPAPIKETVSNVTYSGDFGTIVGSGQTNVGVGSTGIILDLFIPINSYLRDSSIVGSAITVSGISTGDYLVVNNSNIGFGITSLYSNNSIIGIGTTAIDNVYQVSASSIVRRAIPGIGITYVNRISVNVLGLNGENFDQYFTPQKLDSFIGTFDSIDVTFDSTTVTFDYEIRLISENYGSFSWGKITLGSRKNPKVFNSYFYNGISGISTSSLVNRKNPLKYNNYN